VRQKKDKTTDETTFMLGRCEKLRETNVCFE